MDTDHFELYPRSDGEWGWRLRSANGEIVAGGEGHRDRHDARRAALDLVAMVRDLGDLEIRTVDR